MPIQVKCSCGKSLAVPDKYAGKRIKCPGCESALTVPAQTAAAKPAAISVKCKCGKTLGVKPELAGKKVKCPTCQAVLAIPAVAAVGATTSGSQAKPAAIAKPERDDLSGDMGLDDIEPGSGNAFDDLGGGLDSLLDEVNFKASEGPRCPECRTELTEDAVLCVKCGYNLQTGKKLKTVKVEKIQKSKLLGPPTAAAKSQGTDRPKIDPSTLPSAVKNLRLALMACGGLVIVGLLAAIGMTLPMLLGVMSNPQGGMAEKYGIAAMYFAGYGLIGGIAYLYFKVANLVANGDSNGRLLAIILGFPFVAPLFFAFSKETKEYCKA
ncbi:MAG: hypothetical protein R3C28_12335 [Pirellulaceae bacterium]